jgi:hypothetical protein
VRDTLSKTTSFISIIFLMFLFLIMSRIPLRCIMWTLKKKSWKICELYFVKTYDL